MYEVKEKDLGKEFPSVLDSAYKESQRHKKIADIMSRDVVTTTTDTPMDDAAKIMGKKHIGSLIVEKYGTPIGIVTERDLLTKVLAGKMDLRETKVEDVMSFPLVKVCPTTEIREAAQMMIRRKGRLAVFDCGDLVGIITASDLIRGMPDAPETSLRVDDFMSRDVVTVDESASVARAAEIMGSKRIGSVLVTRKKELRGIFTERDLLSAFLAKGMPLDVPVGETSSSPLCTAPVGISIHEAAALMATKHIRRLPLLKNREVAGIITARDLVEAYAK
ncbi:MAG TPA: CBS domain-containing protein [Methanomicrobiales archaeon]|nr:CBS domain-containing protein [Methanomicrobiales archaeon]